MSLSRDSKAERIARFLLRQQLRTKQGIERIEFEEAVIIPAIEALKSGKAVPQLGLEAGKAFRVVVEDEDHPQAAVDSSTPEQRDIPSQSGPTDIQAASAESS